MYFPISYFEVEKKFWRACQCFIFSFFKQKKITQTCLMAFADKAVGEFSPPPPNSLSKFEFHQMLYTCTHKWRSTEIVANLATGKKILLNRHFSFCNHFRNHDMEKWVRQMYFCVFWVCQRPILNFVPRGKLIPRGEFCHLGWSYPLWVKFSVCHSILLNIR
jgi:hypothetical protein